MIIAMSLESPVSSLPENLQILQHLTHLIVVQCQLVKLPLCILTLCQLQLLDVTGNKIVSCFIISSFILPIRKSYLKHYQN